MSSEGEDAVVAGVVSLGFPDTETGKHRSEVGRLIVSPDYRKRGLARRMMEVLEVVAREKGRWMMVSFFDVLFMFLLRGGVYSARSTNGFTAP